ncbi:efflux transporter outer membrane subunit [Delftia sp. PS-11]|uniref:efflux transporter outer membrane subunit n=1 Tax=Delftia sp. PS-11 TaxID=2767222 RepID=UPI00245505B3|nr:efflux transporter outer membrane subunit [Delftia sp. PS-11]KAJ8742211.1 efflux transporter outer membrane subunit [Delftia sp. PS-11]
MKNIGNKTMCNAHLGSLALILAALGGCTARQAVPDSPAPALASAWTQALPGQGDAVSPLWWQSFGSPELDAMVQAAQSQSLDIAAAMARVRQAEAATRGSGAALLPSLAADTGAQRASRTQAAGGGGSGRYTAALTASYEVDFWGRHRAGRDAAAASWQASRFDQATVQLTVTAQVANAWLQAVALRERQAIGAQNLANARRLLALVESRARAGAATQLELAQQRGLVASLRQTLAALRRQGEDAEAALAVLLGRAQRPQLATDSLQALQLPEVGAGLPAQLLQRRPDIAQAEARLAAASANLQAARAALWPRLTLTGGATTSAARATDWLREPVYSLLAGLAGPIFDGGLLAAQRDGAQARREELLAAYHQSIVVAYGDVDLALNAVQGLQAQSEAQSEVLAQARQAVSLAELRYQAGAESLLSLLQAQATLYAAQDDAVLQRLLQLQARVALFRALGGGWGAEPAPQAQKSQGASLPPG